MLRSRHAHGLVASITTPPPNLVHFPAKIPIRFATHPAIPRSLPSPVHEHSDFYAHLLLSCSKRLNTSKNARQLLDEKPQAAAYCRVLHARILRLQFPLLSKLLNCLIDLYSKSGDLAYAQKTLHESGDANGDATSWNSILTALSKMGALEDVLKSFGSMRNRGALPDQFTSAIVLSACAKLAVVGYGRQVHGNVLKMGFSRGSFCVGSLIDMYGKCGLVDDARTVLDEVQCTDTVSWTAMIAGYARVGRLEEALGLFEKMVNNGCVLDVVTYVTVITACMAQGRLHDAENMFMQMPSPNDVAWNAMISGFARNENQQKALEFFRLMRQAGLHPTRSTLASVLSVAANLMTLDFGCQVQTLAIKLGLDANVFIGSSLINIYAKSCALQDARKAFDTLNEKNLVTWNAMLGGYSINEKPREVLELFFEMKELGIQFDAFTYVSLFCACACLENLKLGQQLHSIVTKNNFAGNLFVGNSIIDMYAKSKDLDGAEMQFMCMPTKDIVTWNALIVGLVDNEYGKDALNLIPDMRLSGLMPDAVSIASLLSACADKNASQEGDQVHCVSIKLGLDHNSYVGSSIVNLYAKSERLDSASRAFHLMSDKTVASRNALMDGYILNYYYDEALRLFQQMLNEGLDPTDFTFESVLSACNGPVRLYLGVQLHCHILKLGLLFGNAFVGVALIRMYARFKHHHAVDELLVEMSCSRNPVVWTVIISEHNQNDAGWDALSLFAKMRLCDVLPDQAVFVSVLKSCTDLATIQNGKELHCLIMHTGYHSDVSVCSSLIDFYSKCGDVEASYRIFSDVQNRYNTIILWNSMLVGFAKNGHAESTLMLFRQMEKANIPLDDVTFLGVLTACSHAGRVSEGRSIFDAMTGKYGVKPRYDHYACMVDLLGRGGFLEEAEELIHRMPYQPDTVIWSTLVSSCRMHGDYTRGGRAAEELVKLDPYNSSSYVLLSNMYAMYGNWDGVKMVRKAMSAMDIRKSPGCSWIVVGNNTSCFHSADTSHLAAINIYEALESLNMSLRKDDHDDFIMYCHHHMG